MSRDASTRILVLAGATADLGPRATLQGLCRALRAAAPTVELATTLREDRDDEDAPDPVHGGWCALYQAARRSDLVLVTNDALSAPAARDAALLHLLALRKTPLAGVALVQESVGSRAERWLRQRLLRGFRALTVADERSARHLHALGVAGASVLPDPAVLVPAAFADVARQTLAAARAPADGAPLIGVVPRHVLLRDQTAGASDARLLELLGRVLDHAVERHGAFVVCLPARAGEIALSEALADALRSDRVCVMPMLAPTIFKGVASELTALVSAHRRAALLGAAVGRPTIGFGESPALAAALELAGGQHAFLDASLFLRGGLVGQLGELIDTAVETRRASLVRFEELKAGARSGIRGLLGRSD